MSKRTTKLEMSEEFDRTLHNMCVLPEYSGTVCRDVARNLLALDWIICRGEQRWVRAKHLGVGVYRITTEAVK